MRVEGTYTFPGSIERVFATLINPDALARAIPGCERFIQLGPTSVDGGVTYETRLRAGERRLPYTITLRVKAARSPAYLKLEMRGHGASGAITGDGSLDLVAQDEFTVAAYRFNVSGDGLLEIGDTPSRSANAIAHATCAYLADELRVQTGEDLVWLPGAETAAGDIVTPRGRIITRHAANRSAQAPLAWTERALWMTAGLVMGLGVIALTVGIVRRMGSRHEQTR